MKPSDILIAIPSPRDLPEVIDAIKTSLQEYDKLWIKYSPEIITYPKLHKEFLKSNYKFLALLPDDLVIEKSKLELLVHDYNTLLTEEEKDKTVLSGFCNVDTTSNAAYANVTFDYVRIKRSGRSYRWVQLKQMEYIRQTAETSGIERNYLVKVMFAGFPLMIIPRNVIEEKKIQFRNDYPIIDGVMDPRGCCWDVSFCTDLMNNGIQILVDSRVQLKHLKFSDLSSSELLKQAAKTEKDYDMFYEYATKINKKKELNLPPPPQIMFRPVY